MSAYIDGEGFVTFIDKAVPQALSSHISDSVAEHVQKMLGGDGAVIVGGIAAAAVMRAFGCTCREHGPACEVYGDDLRCRLHKVDGLLTIPPSEVR